MNSRSSLLALLVVALIALPSAQAQNGGLLGALLGGNPTKESRESAKPVPKGKRVEVNLTKQELRAYEGNRLVLKTNISSGRTHNTPTGNFRAGPYKAESHFSSLYHNAPMPWSVQVTGNIFIHGYTEVPRYPASKGCIRMPLTGRNAAKRFYQWCDVGTPIRIFY